MQPVQKPITGQENPADLSSPQQALSQFYRAFNTCDMKMMVQNWAPSDDIVMDNPLGGITRDCSEIQPVYARLFEGPAEVYVEYYDYTLHETGEMFYTVGRERGYLRSGNVDLTLAIRTSRLYKMRTSTYIAPFVAGWLEKILLIGSCRQCGGTVRIITCIDDPAVIEKICTHLDKKGTPQETAFLPEGQVPLRADFITTRLFNPGCCVWHGRVSAAPALGGSEQ
jgi:hypothetical protein